MDIFNDFNVTRFEKKLKNGIRVILFYRAGAPITTHAILNSGSKYDPAHMYGVSHFLEHMITDGSVDFPSKDLLAEHIESAGGIYGAWTSQNAMCVHTEISEKADYSRVVDIFNATLCKPLMDVKFFENEKKIIVKEIERSESNSSQVMGKAVRKAFFPGTMYGHEVLGTKESILGLKYDDCISTYKKLFDKTRITFIASGDISIDELCAQLETLSFLEGNPFIDLGEPVTITGNKKVYSEFFDAPQTYVYFGFIAPPFFTKEYSHLHLLGGILGGGRASRLIKRLRYEKGLVYGASFGRYGGLDVGSFGVSAETSDDKVQEVLDEMIHIINDIKENGVKESELEFIKNKKIKSLKRSMQTSADWVTFHAISEVFAKDPYDVNLFVKETQATTVEDIKNIAKKYFIPENFQLVLTGRTKEDAVRINW